MTTDQDRIWVHYQGDGSAVFESCAPRLAWLVRRLGEPCRVLDVGVGDGTFERLALEVGHEVHALDPGEEAIASLRARLGLGERAQTGRIESIPFPDAAFDAVVVSEVLEHLPDAVLPRALDELRRVLVPGGRLVGTVPYRENLAAEQAICPECGCHFHRWGHHRSFDRPELERLLRGRFARVETTPKIFPHWAALNWKGRVVNAARLVLAACGVHGVGATLTFVAWRD